MTATPPSTAWGFGLATLDAAGTVLDVWFPAPALGEKPADAAPAELGPLAGPRRATAASPARCCLVEIADLQAAPTTTEDVWLRLHLLSSRLVVPHSISLDGIFGLLTNVVWTSAGPCAVEGFELTRRAAAGQRPARHRLRGRQVPPDGRLRAADRRPDRRRRPGPPRRPPGRGHHGHARGLRQLQRRHPRREHGRGPDLGGRRGRRRLRRRWRLLDHGHPVRAAASRSSRSASAACSARTPASASRSATTASSRPAATSPPGTKVTVADADPAHSRTQVIKARRALGRQQRALPPQLGDRRDRGGAVEERRRSSSTPRCTRTDAAGFRRALGRVRTLAP